MNKRTGIGGSKVDYVIDRSKWVCGGPENQEKMGHVRMLNDKGRMCCLGQIAKLSGVGNQYLKHKQEPADVESGNIPDWMVTPEDANRNTSLFAREAMRINDTDKINQTQRELQLKQLFKSAGISIQFKGKLFVAEGI